MASKDSTVKKELSFKTKLILVMVIIIAVANTAITIIRGQIVRIEFYKSKGTTMATTLTLNRKSFLSEVNAEKKLALQTAKLPSMINYCKNPSDKALAKNAKEEMEAFAKSLDIGQVFYVSDVDKHFYFVPDNVDYFVDPNKSEYYWYNMTMNMPVDQPFNFNINYSKEIGKTQLWMNAVVRDENGKSIGISGSGITLSDIVASIYENVSADFNMFLFNDDYEIVGARDLSLVEQKAGLNKVIPESAVKKVQELKKDKNLNISGFRDGSSVYVVCTIPEIGWNIVSYSKFLTRMMFVGEGSSTWYIILALLMVIAIFVGKIIWIFYNMTEKEKGIGNNLLVETQNLVVSTKETAATSQDQSAAVKEIVATMEDSNALSENISQKIKDVASVAEKTSSDVTKGSVALTTNVDKLHEIFEANQQTINGIKVLGDKIENIWDIVTLINNVADQAKIIAFNAELEAASAGEAGKNFHIVASEIRRLADSIIDGTKEIKEKINEIQQSSDSLILASESGTEKINEGCDAAKELEENFASIQSAAEITAASANQITDIIQQQTVGSGQILITLKQIASGVENFTAATENISTAAQNIKGIADDLSKAVEDTGSKKE